MTKKERLLFAATWKVHKWVLLLTYLLCGRCITLQLDEAAIIFIYCTQFLTTNWCDITQGAAITCGTATSFGLGALEFDSRQGQGIFCSSKDSESLWDPHCSLLSGYQGFCLGCNTAGAWSWPLISIEVKNEWRYTFGPPTWLRGGTTLLCLQRQTISVIQLRGVVWC